MKDAARQLGPKSKAHKQLHDTVDCPKESQLLWQRLQAKQGFDCNTTLFIDDSIEILKSAQQFGIKHLLAIANPDSKKQTNVIKGFSSITDFKLLVDQLAASKA